MLLDKVEVKDWRPAVSAGLVFRGPLHSTTSAADAFGIGVGGHFVFVPQTDGGSKPAPALTIHIGKASTQLFFGMVFVPTDNLSQVSTGIFPVDFDEKSLIIPGGTTTRSFFAGIVIGGVPILQ